MTIAEIKQQHMYILIFNCIQHKSLKKIIKHNKKNIVDGGMANRDYNIYVQSLDVLKSEFLFKIKKKKP